MQEEVNRKLLLLLDRIKKARLYSGELALKLTHQLILQYILGIGVAVQEAAMAVRAGRTRKCVSAWILLLQGGSCVSSEIVWDGLSSSGAIVVLDGEEAVVSCVDVGLDCFALRLMPYFPPAAKF